MKINQLDLGGSHPWAMPTTGQQVDVQFIEGDEFTVFARGSIERTQNVRFTLRPWQAIGGQAAYSSGAAKYLLKQLEELASNPRQMPVYIQWNQTAESGALLAASELHDGWYVIEDFAPDYGRNVVTGLVECRMTVVEVASAPPLGLAVAYTGGALTSNYSITPVNLITLPYAATALEASFNRTVAGGLAVPSILSPVANPEPFVLSLTLANLFEKGRVAVYDTVDTSANPVPTSGGTYVHANWIEVLHGDHNFIGDCVITNGLLLLLIQVGQQLASLYLWNTATATANWQTFGTLISIDNAGTQQALTRQYSLNRVGPEECAITTISSTSLGSVFQTRFRLQRGRFECRVDFTPLTLVNASNDSLAILYPANVKILYNSFKVADQVLAETSPTISTDYGYGAGFVASSAQSYIAGFLYQNQPTFQPHQSTGAFLGLGDNSGPGIGAQRSYGFFAIPYGVNASYSTANLQAEAEGGTLGTGWTSQANAAASAGNEAKCASGTLAANADTFGTAFVPAVGTYDVWFRMKVTSAAASSVEMQVGLWDSDTAAFVASTTFNRNAITTAYAWYRAATAVTPTATKNMRFRCVTALTLTTDWFIDEAVMVPKALTADNRGPQDIWKQFMYDRAVRLVRP